MKNTISRILKAADSSSLQAAIAELAPEKNEAILVLVGEHCALDVAVVLTTLQATNATFFGGLFPGIIYGQERFDSAIVLLKVPTLAAPFFIKSEDLERSATVDFPLANYKRSMICLVDGLMGRIGEYLEYINNNFGDQFSFIGGGAGSLDLVQKPCLFTREGIVQDAALCCLLDKRIRLGVRHGWERLAGPFVVTASQDNTVQQLNWQEAFQVYKEVVEQDAGVKFNDENFFSIAKGYPFGMIREGSEDIVRDPIMTTPTGELVCVGEVPANSVLFILKGEANNLIAAAEKAYIDSQQLQQSTTDPVLIVDCISRTLFLEDDFEQELQQIEATENPAVGMLSLGEISSFGQGSLEFFNKTIVLGQLLPAAKER